MYRVHKKLDKICEGAISRASVASLTARGRYSASASMEHGTHREQPRPTANELAPADRMLISGPLLLLKFPPGKRNLAHTHSPHTTLCHHRLKFWWATPARLRLTTRTRGHESRPPLLGMSRRCHRLACGRFGSGRWYPRRPASCAAGASWQESLIGARL